MAIKNTLLGGTDWASGNRLNAADLNDTFNAGVLCRKRHTGTTARTHTGNTDWTDSAETFSITHSANALLIGIYVKCTLNSNNSAHAAYSSVKIAGTTLGNKYIHTSHIRDIGADDDTRGVMISTDDDVPLFLVLGTATYDTATSMSPLLLLPDTSTTFTVRLRINNSGSTVTANQFEIIVLWANAISDK